MQDDQQQCTSTCNYLDVGRRVGANHQHSTMNNVMTPIDTNHHRDAPDDDTDDVHSSISSKHQQLRQHPMTNHRLCTSYRLHIADMKNPVDMCTLDDDQRLAIADYDNGLLIVGRRNGDTLRHLTLSNGRNACGVCTIANHRLLVLGYKDGIWSIHVYGADDLQQIDDTIDCPDDAGIETWAVRKIAATTDSDGDIFLMATGEHRSVIWALDLIAKTWKVLVTESSRRGIYNDFDIKRVASTNELHFLLCDYKRSQLSTVIVSASDELAGIQAIRMRRVKGQEWIVQGPKLAVWDAHDDLVLFDGSGKLFWFDGRLFKCRRIVADIGKGEVGAVCVDGGWCFALCRYRLCIDAFLYRQPEQHQKQ